jgi:hypothetical protein
MLKVYIEHAKHGEICLKSSSSSAPKSSPESSGTESIASNKEKKEPFKITSMCQIFISHHNCNDELISLIV